MKATNVTFRAGHVTRKKRGEVIGQRGGSEAAVCGSQVRAGGERGGVGGNT